MNHALVISSDRLSIDILEEGLWSAGYHSILSVNDRDEAWLALHDLRPNLIVVASDVARTVKVGDLYQMSDIAGAPIVVATDSPAKTLHCLGPAASSEPRYSVHEQGAIAGLRSPSHRSDDVPRLRAYG